MRYLRAFWRALRLTLRGETYTPPSQQYPALRAWMQQTVQLVDTLYGAFDREGLPQAARQALTLKIEGRTTTVQTILSAVRYHAVQEYPYLLKNPAQNHVGVIRATNLDDHYYMEQLGQVDLPERLRPLLDTLKDHLSAIPNGGD